MSIKELIDFYLGFDIGTDSIGWAVTNCEYKLRKFKGNAMWGVRLYEESETAEVRRLYRGSVRRGERKKQRIAWLQMLFDREISKIDRAFFIKLKESNLYFEDKSTGVPFAVFSDKDYTDKEFHNQYKTIYHLRKELIENDSYHDVRLVYLALHHIIKHRGHFLFDNLGDDIKSINSFDYLFDDLRKYLQETFELEVECSDITKFSDTIKDKTIKKTAKLSKLSSLCGVTKKSNPQIVSMLGLLCGSVVSLADIFNDSSYNEEELKKITFSGDFDEKQADYQSILLDEYELIEKLKAIYDWAVLADILSGEKYISYAKVNAYETHKSDLEMLKSFVKTYCKEKYYKIFRETKKGLYNYTAYCGKYKVKGQNGSILERATQEEFCGFLKKELSGFSKMDDSYIGMFNKIESGIFMPKQITKDNGVIPMQLNRQELKIILENTSKYLDFLNEKDADGISVKDKIVKIFEFRIPYYVGPLNKHSDKAWLERKDGKIYPWNFDKIVDIEKSAEKFINNLTSKCTYLRDKDVIPKNSILYSKFMVFNELNNLKIDGESIDNEIKQSIFNELFLNKKKVTLKAIRNFIKSTTGNDVEITGIDKEIKSNMGSYIDLKKFNLNESEMEDIIFAITVFGDDRKLLKSRLNKQLEGKHSKEDIKKISQLKYKDWGAFSREFLTEIYDVSVDTGEVKSNIIDTLWNTNDNLMVLLGSKYNFRKSIEIAVQHIQGGDNLKEMVDSLYISPSVKRPVYQSLKIANEITKICGKPPKKIFVEMTRYHGQKGDKGRKDSRKERLMKLYETCKDDYNELYSSLIDTPEDKFRQDKLYFYYTQFGKCMYSGEPITLDNLFKKDIYDIDHIFPRSKVKDDSLDNRVLVKKSINAHKDNDYPISSDVQSKMKGYWKFLLDKGLISKKKYDRLTRVAPLTDNELSDFIARQIVETGQSTKAVAELFKKIYPETDIVYVKASNVSEFRHKYDMLKCRSVNDLHHAKDAYLNVVVGNVYDEKFTRNRANFIKGLQTKKQSLSRIFDYNQKDAWIADNNTSLSTVKKIMSKNNIIVTRYSSKHTGTLFKLNPLKKGNGQVPLKKNSPLSDISKYGGYDKATSAYFAFIKHTGKKGKILRQFVPIDNYEVHYYEENPEIFMSEKGFVNPEILIPVVKYNACIEMDGFKMNISSKSEERLVCKPAVQLVVGYHFERYIKKIEKVLEKSADYEVNEFDEITLEMNLGLYDELIYKCTSTVFKVRFSSIGEKLNKGRELFKKLTLREQCFVIGEILKILHNNVLAGDLTLIGESKKTGTLKINSAISEIKGVSEIKIVNQSVTGLFETKVDLLKD